MTKLTTLAELLQEEPKQEVAKKKPIEFKSYLQVDGEIGKDCVKPTEWDNILLIEKDYGEDFDLMLAWDELGFATLFLGHWNDGVVE